MDKEKIYSEFHRKVYGYILSKVGNSHDAEDIAADVFVKLYAKLDTFDESKASLSTWIYTLTRNTLTDFYRTRRVFEEIPESQDDGYSVEDEICNAQTLETLAQALETLDERERDIVIFRYYSGKTLKDISEQMNISYSYVKVLQNKAFAKLRIFFENR